MGNNARVISASPVFASTLGSLEFQEISSGESYSCVLNQAGQVHCWGYGILGDNKGYRISESSVHVSEMPVLNPMPEITQVSVGSEHACAVTIRGKVLCWGKGESGRLGNGAVDDSLLPDYVYKDLVHLNNIKQVSAAEEHTCALQENSTIPICWGSGKGGQLGHEEYNDSPYPVRVGSLDADTIRTIPKQNQVAAGDLHTCAIQNDGELYCWGDGGNGRLGRGSNHSDSNTPIVAIANSSYSGELTQISLGSWHTCILGSDGHVLCAGVPVVGGSWVMEMKCLG